MARRLDIIIPVYNEGTNIPHTLAALAHEVKAPARVMICYDSEEDDTLPAVKCRDKMLAQIPLSDLRKSGRGAHRAVMSGFADSSAPFVVVFSAPGTVTMRTRSV